MLSRNRDQSTAKAFFTKAICSSGIPDKITIDKSGANKAGIKTINFFLSMAFLILQYFGIIQVRQIKYLNNIVEQDHRGIKRIVDPMMGFKTFESATATLAGIELHRMLRKGQHSSGSANTNIFEQFASLAA